MGVRWGGRNHHTQSAQLGERNAPSVTGNRPHTLMAVLGVMILVAIACGDSSEGTTTPRAGAAITTTFDGEACNYEGPSVLSPGDIEITVHNLTEETTWFTFARLKTDKTIENLIDYIKDTPSAPKPDWVQRAWYDESVSAGSTATAIVVLEPGFYGMVCGTYPEFTYFGAGLTVEE